MPAKKAKFHEFHFVQDEGSRQTLQELMQETAGRSFTKFISGVLKLLYPWLEHEHFFGKERQSRYEFVNADPGVRRLHMHVDLPYSLYKRMKLMYQDLNFFSIAQLVRWVLGEYVRLTKQYGKGVREVVEERLSRRCTAAGIDMNLTDNPGRKSGNQQVDDCRKKIRQLFKILDIDIEEISLLTCYNGLSSPRMILKC